MLLFPKIYITNVFKESKPQFIKILFINYTQDLLFLANSPILSDLLLNFLRSSLNLEVL